MTKGIIKHALVTGADGFIGSNLVRLLLDRGIKVRALSLYNSFNTFGWLENIECRGKKLSIFTGDIRDRDLCNEMMKGIDTVFHLAALIAIPYSYRAPESYFSTNVTGTLNLCRAALKAGCRRFVHTSTSEVYGTAQYVPIDENHPLNAQSPYSASKIAADALCTSFYHTFGLPLVILRPFNTYGPCQSARAVIPTIITQILMGEKEIKLGSLHPLRDLNYVEDTCAAFYALACAEPKGEVFNAGSGREISIGDLARLIASLMGADVVFTVDPQRIRPESSEVNRLCCDSSKLFRATGFCNSHTLEQGLLKTIEWFKKPDNINKYKAGIYNV